MKKRILCLCTALFSLWTNAYDVKTPALVPVKFQNAPKHDALKIVDNGELKFAIVTDKNAENIRRWREHKSIGPAVELLVEAFEKCTGKKPQVFDVSEIGEAEKYPFQILVGDSALTRKLGLDALNMPKQGYEIKTFPRGIAIVGSDSSRMKDYSKDSGPLRGTLWGAYDFVERFLGCRFFYPGEFGSLWPKIDNLGILPVI